MCRHVPDKQTLMLLTWPESRNYVQSCPLPFMPAVKGLGPRSYHKGFRWLMGVKLCCRLLILLRALSPINLWLSCKLRQLSPGLTLRSLPALHEKSCTAARKQILRHLYYPTVEVEGLYTWGETIEDHSFCLSCTALGESCTRTGV